MCDAHASSVGTLLTHGSLVFIFAWLALGGLGVPLPEDVALLAAGALMYQGDIAPWIALPILFVGVLSGDVALFLLAKRLGPAAYDKPRVKRILPPERRQRIEEMYRRHGGKLVFIARHVMGLRAAVFAFAGINGMPLKKFLFWDGLAACITVPATLILGYAGALHIDRVHRDVKRVEHWVVLAVVVAVVAFVLVRKLRCSHYDRSCS